MHGQIEVRGGLKTVIPVNCMQWKEMICKLGLPEQYSDNETEEKNWMGSGSRKLNREIIGGD